MKKIPNTKYQIPNTKIIVILGPTSSGKSDIAIKLAKKFDGEVISADSRQIYRGMDIGTGKIPGKLVAIRPHSSSAARSVRYKIFLFHGTPHHMIDIISPRTSYNVAKFKKQSEKIIENILKRGKLPILCGGTGFWIQSIVDNVNFPEVKPDWKLREKLEKYSVEKLFAMLKKIDPARAKNIDSKNKVRLIRAIEICKKIKKIPPLRSTFCACLPVGKVPRYAFLQIGLKLTKEKLHENIENRVKNRFQQGMVAEVKKIRASGLSWKKIQSFGLAYFWIPLYLQKKISFGESDKSLALRNLSLRRREKPSFDKKELIEKVIQAEKNYAKRQMTWFKRDKRIKWLKNYPEIEKSVRLFLK